MIPVQNATAKDWNNRSFWYYSRGKSGVHKGINILAKKSTPVLSSTSGLVIFTGNLSMGFNVISVLGTKWHVHYYAHHAKVETKTFSWVRIWMQLVRLATQTTLQAYRHICTTVLFH